MTTLISCHSPDSLALLPQSPERVRHFGARWKAGADGTGVSEAVKVSQGKSRCGFFSGAQGGVEAGMFAGGFVPPKGGTPGLGGFSPKFRKTKPDFGGEGGTASETVKASQGKSRCGLSERCDADGPASGNVKNDETNPFGRVGIGTKSGCFRELSDRRNCWSLPLPPFGLPAAGYLPGASAPSLRATFGRLPHSIRFAPLGSTKSDQNA